MDSSAGSTILAAVWSEETFARVHIPDRNSSIYIYTYDTRWCRICEFLPGQYGRRFKCLFEAQTESEPGFHKSRLGNNGSQHDGYRIASGLNPEIHLPVCWIPWYSILPPSISTWYRLCRHKDGQELLEEVQRQVEAGLSSISGIVASWACSKFHDISIVS